MPFLTFVLPIQYNACRCFFFFKQCLSMLWIKEIWMCELYFTQLYRLPFILLHVYKISHHPLPHLSFGLFSYTAFNFPFLPAFYELHYTHIVYPNLLGTTNPPYLPQWYNIVHALFIWFYSKYFILTKWCLFHTNRLSLSWYSLYLDNIRLLLHSQSKPLVYTIYPFTISL